MSAKGYIVTLVGGRGRGGDDDEDSVGAAEDAGENIPTREIVSAVN